MNVITGKNSTWLNPPHVGGIVDPEVSCPRLYCEYVYGLLKTCELTLCLICYS